MSVKNISDNKLIERLQQLVATEKECTSEIVLHLSEIESRRLYAEMGYASLFDYATRGLGYSRMSAQRRIVAARVVVEMPQAYEMLRVDRLSLAHFEVIATAFDGSNAPELVRAVAGKSVEQARIAVARACPLRVAPIADKIEPVVYSHPIDRAQRELFENESQEAEGEVMYRISFTARDELRRKLEEAQKIIFGFSKDNCMETLLDEVVDFYLERCSPKEREKRRAQKKAKTDVPKSEAENLVEFAEETKEIVLADKKTPRRPSIALRDRVLKRDGYRCSYTAPDGTECGCEVGLEIDHRIPWARGGRTEESNLRVLCRAHNQLAARQEFGAKFIEEKSSYSRSGVGDSLVV